MLKESAGLNLQNTIGILVTYLKHLRLFPLPHSPSSSIFQEVYLEPDSGSLRSSHHPSPPFPTVLYR